MMTRNKLLKCRDLKQKFDQFRFSKRSLLHESNYNVSFFLNLSSNSHDDEAVKSNDKIHVFEGKKIRSL